MTDIEGPITGQERRRDSSSSSRRWRRYWAFCIVVSKLILKNTQEAKVIGPSKICNIFCRGLQSPGKNLKSTPYLVGLSCTKFSRDVYRGR
jgi:hypothetical protein